MAIDFYTGLELAINYNGDVLDKSGTPIRNGTVDGMTYDTSTPMIESGNGVFDGINDDVEIDVAGAKSGILDSTVGTVALWTRDLVEDERPYLFTISTAGVAFPNSDEWILQYDGRVGVKWVQVSCVNGGSIIMSAVTPVNSLPTGNGKHLIIVRAKASGNIEILIDDVLQTPLGSAPLGARFFGHCDDADTMRIGSLERDTISYRGSKDLDALAIWSVPISDETATAYYNNGDGIELEVEAALGAPSMMLGMVG